MDQTTREPLIIQSTGDTLAVGKKLASLCIPGVSIYLSGVLGAGKTTLVRGILYGLGHEGRVKSPSYALVESYRIMEVNVYHIDLYRLTDPHEIENLGLRDYMDGRSVCLLEWPERAKGLLPPPEVDMELTVVGDDQRALRVLPGSEIKHSVSEDILNELGLL